MILNADVRVQAYRHMYEQEMWGDFSGTDHVTEDSVADRKYKIYRGMVGAYMDEGRYEDALAVIDEMEEELPEYYHDRLEEGRKGIRERRARAEAEEGSSDSQDESGTQKEETPDDSDVGEEGEMQGAEPSTQADENGAGSAEASTRNVVLGSILLGVIGLFVVYGTWAYIRRRRS